MQHLTTCNEMECGDRKPDQFDCQRQRNNELIAVVSLKKNRPFSVEHNVKGALESRNSAIHICQVRQCNKLMNKVLFYM